MTFSTATGRQSPRMADPTWAIFKLGKWHGKGDLHRASGAHYVGDFVEGAVRGAWDPDLRIWKRVHRRVFTLAIAKAREAWYSRTRATTKEHSRTTGRRAKERSSTLTAGSMSVISAVACGKAKGPWSFVMGRSMRVNSGTTTTTVRGRLFVPGRGTFEGEFRNGQFDGAGTTTFVNGNLLTSSYRAGLLHGSCTLQMRDGGIVPRRVPLRCSRGNLDDRGER
jgi:hypothetical protein